MSAVVGRNSLLRHDDRRHINLAGQDQGQHVLEDFGARRFQDIAAHSMGQGAAHIGRILGHRHGHQRRMTKRPDESADVVEPGRAGKAQTDQRKVDFRVSAGLFQSRFERFRLTYFGSRVHFG